MFHDRTKVPVVRLNSGASSSAVNDWCEMNHTLPANHVLVNICVLVHGKSCSSKHLCTRTCLVWDKSLCTGKSCIESLCTGKSCNSMCSFDTLILVMTNAAEWIALYNRRAGVLCTTDIRVQFH